MGRGVSGSMPSSMVSESESFSGIGVKKCDYDTYCFRGLLFWSMPS